MNLSKQQVLKYKSSIDSLKKIQLISITISFIPQDKCKISVNFTMIEKRQIIIELVECQMIMQIDFIYRQLINKSEKLISLQITIMSRNKHQIYFDKADYIKFLQHYQDNTLQPNTQYQLLLVAKAYFIQQLYTECIALLKRLSHKNKAKLLFQRQALMFKASYLLDSQNINQLTSIVEEFQYAQRFVTDKSFLSYHLNTFKEFRAFIETLLSLSNTSLPKIPQNEEDTDKIKEEGNKILQQQKHLQKQHKLQGFPCYLVSKQWRQHQVNYHKNIKNVRRIKDKNYNIVFVSEQPSHPGPITNFNIVNHIFEIIPYESKVNSFLNVILFPGEEYEVVSRNHGNYLFGLYGGVAVKRVYGSVPLTKFSTETSFNEKMIVKLLIKYIQKVEVMQVSAYSIWLYAVLPQLWTRYGLGQLKQQQSEGNYRLVGTGKVYQPQSQLPLKYINFQNDNIYNLTAQDIKFRNNLFHTFDFQKYSIQHSPSKGLVGLTNDKFMCFMNSTLQCLSNTYDLTKFFMHNQYVKCLNYSKDNFIGSRAEITCAYADIVKKIWTLNTRSQKEAEINPTIFKQVFAKRFELFTEDSQQDAHEFLNFLLNCMHDDLNTHFKTGSNKILKPIKDSTNFDEVRKTFMQNYENNNNSEITHLFKGYTYSTLKCMTCEEKYYNFDMHLTFPLPVPATASSLVVSFVSSRQLDGDVVRYSVYLEGLTTVNDLIKVIQAKQGNLSPTRATTNQRRQSEYFLLGINKQYFKVQNYFNPEINITQLINVQGKMSFLLYQVTKGNTHNSRIQEHQIEIEIQDSQQQDLQPKEKLTLIQYLYDDERMGYPKLLYVDIQASDQKLLEIAAYGIPDQALKYSGGVATQNQKMDCVDKVRMQKIKGKPYQSIMKVKLAKRLPLYQSKEKIQNIGQSSKNSEFTLQNCLTIFQQKDKILMEEGWICAKCKKVSACQKQQKIYSVGAHLIIVLKRFKQGAKVCTKINYPIQNFDITGYVDEHYKESNPSTKFTYDLYGVIVHRGTLNRGHYYSYCKNYHSGKWFLFDDELVREEEDLNLIIDENAYVLFYRNKSQ